MRNQIRSAMWVQELGNVRVRRDPHDRFPGWCNLHSFSRRRDRNAAAAGVTSPRRKCLGRPLSSRPAGPNFVTSCATKPKARSALDRRPGRNIESSKIICLSRFHFSRAFKVAVGRSPHHYVSAKRLELAKQLLEKGDQPLPHMR